jgi:hypothetical protein
MLAQVHTKLVDLEAFCTVCPPDEEVTAFLEELGFHLTFSMPVMKYGKRSGQSVPDLPAQFHYKDDNNTEVIYLAGKDHSARDEAYYPHHASRWWVYAGSSQYNYNLVMQSLSAKYTLKWK